MNRCVEPEILDTLEADDPRAVRSRRDLRLINWFMRGEAWLLRQLDHHQPQKVVELGAGEGSLVSKIAHRFPSAEVVGVDFIPRPSSVLDSVKWYSGDVLEYPDFDSDTVVVANLFLHHLSDDQLCALAGKLTKVKAVIVAEPYRGKLPIYLGYCLFPFINDVTRHDMIVSIKAGFRIGEIPKAFAENFNWSEERGFFGGIRSLGQPRKKK